MVRRSLGRRTQSPQTLIPDELWSELHLLGEVLTAAGLIQPGLAFARYRKR
jgi:hypothetical protein